MTQPARLSLAVGSAVIWAAVAFALVICGERVWAPVDYAYPGTVRFWLAGAVGRLLVYLTVSALQVVTWRALTNRQANTAMASVLLGTVVWLFWMVAQPTALFSVISGPASVWLADAVRDVPVIGEIYNAWGFNKYLHLLVLLHAVIAVALLLLLTRPKKPGLDGAPVTSD
jgi:hypothetical protein